MCQFASFYVTRDLVYYGPTDSHSDIIEHHKLVEDGVRGPNGERVEITPPTDPAVDASDLSTWIYKLDQDLHTDWHEDDPGLTEVRAREALARRAAEELWFVRVDGQALVGGYGATLTGGYGATLTGGNRSTLTGDNGATLTGGNESTLTGDNGATLTGGYGATLTGGNRSTLMGGNRSTLMGGDDSTLTGGNGATLTGGDDSTLTGGNGATLVLRYFDGQRYRLAVAYVGESGILPGVAYKHNSAGAFVRADGGA